MNDHEGALCGDRFSFDRVDGLRADDHGAHKYSGHPAGEHAHGQSHAKAEHAHSNAYADTFPGPHAEPLPQKRPRSGSGAYDRRVRRPSP